jgi:putative two-component system response regulator
MSMRFKQWTDFLAVDEGTVATLQEFSGIVFDRMEEIMDAVYAHIASHESASQIFKSEESMQHARNKQKRHWTDHVLIGNFDKKYLENVELIGRTHYRMGVDLMFYVGVYSIVMNQLIRIVSESLEGRPKEKERYLAALNRAIFLDKGLATMVYYDALVGAVEEMSYELNFSLARAGEFRDNETGKHIARMSRMCSALAKAIGMDKKWVEMIQIASPLHDVGKIGIPDDVLLKPGRLSEEELAVMRRHPAIGGNIIPEHSSEVIAMARRISLTHHEKWDGSGYPDGLMGGEIPLEGRIAAICDVYDALVSSRPYKQPWPKDAAVGFLKENSGTHFDPDLVDAFLVILPEIDTIQIEFAEAEA